MTETVTDEQFQASDGVAEWQVSGGTATATFATGSFVVGVRFVDAVGELAELAGHHPDVELRYPQVTFRLTTHDAGGLTQADVELARQISEAARELEIPPG